MTSIARVLALLLIVFVIVARGAETLVGAGSVSPAIPFTAIGAKVAENYEGDAIGFAATSGGARLHTTFQKLAGTITNRGLALQSTEDAGGSMQLVAVALGREGLNESGALERLSATGIVSVGNKVVTFARPCLTEEYSVSVDGVRQDFVVAAGPKGTGDLSVVLEIRGATAEAASYGAKLSLTTSGRALAYSRLRVVDATGRELAAKLSVLTSSRLIVCVADVNAVYPVRIDPTFSDANWVSLNSGVPGVGSTVSAAVVDASGNLYVGGGFRVAGAVPANYVAKWDGSAWSALGAGMNLDVNSLAISGTDLYAGGDFSTAGGVTANRIAKWDGSAWSALGAGMDLAVYALMVSGTDVYAGGSFTTAGGVTVNRIAKWDGSTWTPLGSGMDSTVRSLAISGTDLYVGGDFTTAGGVTVNRIAKWDGSTWSPLGSGMDSIVYSLVPSGAGLYAGGDFSTAGGVTANRIAKWDGSAWSALGAGFGNSNTIYSLVLSGADLYAGGNFSTAGGVTVNGIAKWNGSTWSALQKGANGPIVALAVSGTDLYIGGSFSTADGLAATGVAKWDGGTWSALGPAGMNSTVSALAASGTDIYVGGSFTTAGGVTVNRIAKWNGSTWSSLGSGMASGVSALAVSGANLYAGGSFLSAGGVSALFIAKWDGNAWSNLGSGLNLPVDALAVRGTDLYAGGRFTRAGGVTVNRIAKWNGSTWSALGSGMNDGVSALAVGGTDLYAGGSFTTAGGVTVNRIAKWNGSAWSALGTGMNGTVSALAVSGTDIYAGGFFTTAGGVTVNRIAKWNGSTWSSLGSGMGLGPFVLALAVSGADLYAGGSFQKAGGVTVNDVAKWNGSAWSALGTGTDSAVDALAINADNRLFIGGTFRLVGTTTVSPFIAQANLNGMPDIVVTQTSPLIDEGDSVDFGGVTVGSNSAGKTFTVTNPGTADLTSLVMSGGSSEFTVSALGGTSVPVGSSGVSFTVVFTPGTSGPRSASIHISSNVTGGKNPFDINLTGTGLTILQGWGQQYFGNSTTNIGATEDFDGDGVANLLEFGFGTLPNNKGSGVSSLRYAGTLAGSGTITATGQPITMMEGTDIRALFMRRKDYASAGLTYTVQFCADLSGWQDSIDTPTVLADDGANQVVSVPYPAGLTAKGFFRVRVTAQ